MQRQVPPPPPKKTTKTKHMKNTKHRFWLVRHMVSHSFPEVDPRAHACSVAHNLSRVSAAAASVENAPTGRRDVDAQVVVSGGSSILFRYRQVKAKVVLPGPEPDRSCPVRS
jgi:hypothetical protein